ncbi:MAG: hypothetical protein DI630_21085 [Gordonia sp. (in: high G+C Gram-positive bacteria)]|nr:MAG: hypothetical protein DI630_21085 [Gordonia sp. (in: high G+C Gram-positive bacteria)]
MIGSIARPGGQISDGNDPGMARTDLQFVLEPDESDPVPDLDSMQPTARQTEIDDIAGDPT